MGKYITEFIGTFFLVLVVALTGNATAIGSVLMVMVYAGGHISGAHYNPAVTLAVLIRGKINITDAVAYWVVQFIGAIAAYGLVSYFVKELPTEPAPLADTTKALVAEFIATFALAYVVL